MGSVASLQRKYAMKAVRALGGNPTVPATWTVLNNWSAENEGAECLYLILSSMRDGDKSALDFFDSTEIGDTDNDGMPEILDGWGMPIKFIRWPAGFVPPLVPNGQTQQISDATIAPDPYDPMRCDMQWRFTTHPYLLLPLIYSAGPDKFYDIVERLDTNSTLRFAVPPTTVVPNMPNNPFYNVNTFMGQPPGPVLGAPADTDGDGQLRFQDNITNQTRE